MNIVSFGTPLGLAFASGLNAYLPMLAFAVSARWLHLYKINPGFAFVTQTWFIVILVILTILDFVADKIPLIDHTWDAIHTVIRPIAGAIVAAAASGNALSSLQTAPATSLTEATGSYVTLSVISIAQLGILIVLVIGGGLAALSHMTKATTRLLSTATTAGLFNIVLSVGEDVLVLIITLLALFIPVAVLVLLILFFIIAGPQLLRARKARADRRRWI
jgi:Domain of unknown function (DUF4126)